jgi:hypothetical protein
VRREISRHLKEEEGNPELATNSRNNIRDLYRGINKFNRGCQTRSNLVER